MLLRRVDGKDADLPTTGIVGIFEILKGDIDGVSLAI